MNQYFNDVFDEFFMNSCTVPMEFSVILIVPHVAILKQPPVYSKVFFAKYIDS